MDKQLVIQTLVKGGMTEVDANKALVDITPQGSTDADLLRSVAMKDAELDVKKKQLVQATGIAQRALDREKALEAAEKSKTIDSILMDSKFSKDELQDKSLSELQTMRLTLDKSLEKTFAAVAADIEAQKHSKPILLTAGRWNSTTKTFEGGL